MATPIGDAVVKVRIDTTGAQATLDRQEKEQGRIGREGIQSRRRRDDDEREKDLDRRRRRRARVPSTRGGGATRAVSTVGIALLIATYGPAVAQAIGTVLDEGSKGADPVTKAALQALQLAVGFLEDQLDTMSEVIAHIETFLTGVFGSLEDTTAIARAAILFSGSVDVGELVEFFETQVGIRKTEGMGKWASREIIRRELGKGFARSLVDSVKTQE